MAVTSRVGWRAAPAFHYRSDNLYCRVEKVAYIVCHDPLKARLGLPKRCEWQHPRWRFWEGLVPGVAGHRRCVRGGCARRCEVHLRRWCENLKHCEGEAKADLLCVLGGVTNVYVWGMCTWRTGKGTETESETETERE